MRKLLPANFRFSAKISITSLLLAAVMIRCAFWQWDRYLYKVALVKTYEENATISPKEFPVRGLTVEDFAEVLHRRVRVGGRYDFNHQMLVRNRKHRTGPGYWLLTPMTLEDSERAVIVSRGFIPFEDDKKEDWVKYSFIESEEFDAVVQPTVRRGSFLAPKNPEVKPGEAFVEKWLYPDIENMAKQLPYETVAPVYLQRIGGPPQGTFPAEAITINVPPSTHFGYTIEWSLLALVTLTIGFFLQAFPREKKQIVL